MNRKEERIELRLSKHEKKLLLRKAQKSGMTVSDYVRQSLIHSQDGTINIIDTTPLKNAVFELTKQGVNLNQFMKFLNTYGVKVFDAGRAKQVLDRECALLLAVEDSLSALQREAEKGNVFIRIEDGGIPEEKDFQ
ncbi:hypothetical protein BHK98_09190 [Hornefia porci]|uniref:Mobilization protein n=1 Tax=Hornefia porci TaxID=2652292 RepID=A0A1Q9JJ25_9FIRM|nr:hypothetical protein [Hornefia porci]OLR56222.1 hypothetical protein BHK98_09190 [Hornefia porci]